MRTFFDSSALAKRYVVEQGTDQVLLRCREARQVILSIIVVPELISAFTRRRREGLLDRQHYARLKNDLAADVAESTIVDLTPTALEFSLDCLERFSLRSLDALHLGAALASRAELFVSADHRQCEAARQLGLSVDEIGA